MRRAALALFAVALTAAACPAGVVAQAHRDLASLPPEARPHVRYLTLPEGDFGLEDVPAAFAVVAGHVNHLSTTSVPVTPLAVKGTAGRLVRLDLRSYGWDPKVYERLADADPDYHVDVVAPWVGGAWGSEHYAAGSFEFKARAFAPELVEHPDDAARLADVVAWTGSGAPILRADWFFNQTAAQQDRPAGYYDWLGIKDKKSFEQLVGFDPARKRRKIEMREAVSTSGVTRQPRAIARFDADEGGAYWYSIDFQLAKGAKNPLAVFGKDIERQPDGFETFGLLPNGFWATGAFNGQGGRVDAAPNTLATDRASKSNDSQVHVNVSCLRCHQNGGMKSFAGWAKNVATPPLDIYDPDYDRAFLTRQQYLRDMERAMERDRAVFAEAVRTATGMEAKEYLAAYAEFWERYEDLEVGIKEAARKFNTEALDLENAVKRGLGRPPVVYVRLERLHRGQYLAHYDESSPGYVVLQPGSDRVLSVLTLKGSRAQRIPIRQWEEASPLARYYVRGVKR